jgi:hypothetical protein
LSNLAFAYFFPAGKLVTVFPAEKDAKLILTVRRRNCTKKIMFNAFFANERGRLTFSPNFAIYFPVNDDYLLELFPV